MLKRLQKIVSCPNCALKIRLPMVMNKTLQIRCQRCQAEFRIRLESPLLKLFSWNKNSTLREKVKQRDITESGVREHFF